MIERRQVVYENPWVQLLRKDLTTGQDYYCLQVSDYVSVVAQTPAGKVLLVRQFRPPLEKFTLELPAGWIDPGETPAQAVRRELREETGAEALQLTALGVFAVDPGRQSNYQHAFFARVSQPPAHYHTDEVERLEVEVSELYRLMWAGQIDHPMPVAASFLAGLLPIPSQGLPAFRTL